MNQKMKPPFLTEISGSPWSILPESLKSFVMDLSDFQASASFFENDQPVLDSVEYVEQVAILSITKILMKRESYLTRWGIAQSYGQLKHDFLALVESDDVSAIVLDVHSPGGQVCGVHELGQAIYDARGTKPIIAVANDVMASATYWVGSAADEVVATPTSLVGSIGVIHEHTDSVKFWEDMGYKHTVYTAGKYKDASHPHRPADEVTREYYQKQIKEAYRLFVDAVALHRNVDREIVLEKMADASLFIGQQAVEAGLADRIGTLDDVINELVDSTKTETIIGGESNVHQDSGTEAKSARCNKYARRIESRNN